jgi:glycosyltransferase involved in cell wall biosynthesis
VLPSSHKLKKPYEHFKIAELIIENIEAADYITTPNKVLALIIKKYNDKVLYLPNVPDTNQPMFEREVVESDRLRFGWIGGVFHKPDIEPLYRSFTKMWGDKEIKDKFQLCVGGFNPNHEYKEIEKIFTNNYKALDYDYSSYLKQFTPMIAHTMNNQSYKRLWAKGADEYVSMYNELDVALVPLKDNDFNRCKSELKIVEAAAMGKCVIANNTYPYNLTLNQFNSILIGHKKQHQDWYYAMRDCILNPNMVSDLSAQLELDIKELFDINKINKERKDLYAWLIK